jgi:hypothetical protein
VYIITGVHHPKPGTEKSLLETLERFGSAERGHRGLITAFVWKDGTTGVLLGMTLCDTREDHDAARPEMDKALAGADWRTLDSSVEIYRGSAVAWS